MFSLVSECLSMDTVSLQDTRGGPSRGEARQKHRVQNPDSSPVGSGLPEARGVFHGHLHSCMRAPRLYMVADEMLNARKLSERVTQLGYEVCGQAARGEQALEEIPRIRPDLVLMAIGLAG
jgi:hypothetical protein